MNSSESNQPVEITDAADVRRRAIIEIARERKQKEGVLEIDDGAQVSEGDDNGCYLAAWVWVEFAGTRFDKETEGSETQRCDRCGEPCTEIVGCPSGAELCPACFDAGRE